MHHWRSPKDIAWVGDDLVSGPIRGVLVGFHGLGFAGIYEASEDDFEHAKHGILVVAPYYGPWCWMNRQARTTVDELVAEVYKEYGLGDDIPLISTGGSMGGGSALLFARYSPHPVAGVYANCPACDYVYHFTERPDVAHTMYHAFGSYEGDWTDILEEHSPLHQVAHMPNVPYLLIQGGRDGLVSKAHHSDKMVQAMRERGLNVVYRELPEMGHCGPVPDDVSQEIREFIWSLTN